MAERSGPPATGTIAWRRHKRTRKPQWHCRISLLNGKRSPWIALDPNIPEHDREAARAGAKIVSDRTRDEGLVLGGVETVGGWFKRFHEHKESKGLASVEDMRGRARNWILPSLAFKEMADVTRDDIEALVRRLDKAVLAWQEADGIRAKGTERLSPSTAANVWGDIVHAFDEAVRSKEPSLRVLGMSPAANVRGPETGTEREGPVLYSDEVLALVAGKPVDTDEKSVPMYRRRVYAMAIYTMARRSELAALTLDLEHSTITISKQVNTKATTGVAGTKSTKKTKTGRTRTIDIEPALMPLVKSLVAKPEGRGGRLLRVPPPEDCAELLRKDLWTVGVRREALHSSDATRTPMFFHGLRDTGLTHMAVRGDSPIVVQWRGGHTDFKTTQGYIDRGRVEARRIGHPLPPLPSELVGNGGPEDLSPHLSRDESTDANDSDSSYLVATPTGIEPVLPT